MGIITSELSYLYLNTLYGPTKIHLNGCSVQPLFHVVVFHKVRYAHSLGMVSHFGAVLLHDNWWRRMVRLEHAYRKYRKDLRAYFSDHSVEVVQCTLAKRVLPAQRRTDSWWRISIDRALQEDNKFWKRFVVATAVVSSVTHLGRCYAFDNYFVTCAVIAVRRWKPCIVTWRSSFVSSTDCQAPTGFRVANVGLLHSRTYWSSRLFRNVFLGSFLGVLPGHIVCVNT